MKTEPIRNREYILAIKRLLAEKPRDLALFTLGINTNLRASDLTRITVSHIDDAENKGSFEIREKKTGKTRRITLNNTAISVVTKWIEIGGLNDDDYLFLSRKRGYQLCTPVVSRLVKQWCREVGLKGNFGSHTLRKTFGYHAWQAGIDLPRLMVIFNHSNQKQTVEYLCIQEAQIQEVYLKVEL